MTGTTNVTGTTMASVNASSAPRPEAESGSLTQPTGRDANGMDEVRQRRLTGERAEFFAHDRRYVDCLFADGESPLKHVHDVEVVSSSFQWKYPLWYANNVTVRDSTWFEMARAGVWYTHHLLVEDCTVEGPKNFRRTSDVTLRNVDLTHAEETLWNCTGVTLENVVARGDYLAMNCEDVTATNLRLVGNYPFDGARNVTVRDSRLISKDAFWNCENVTIEHSYISGEYLGWNSRNVTLVDCTIESLQGLCYIDNLVMRNCRFVNTTLAFEYSTVDVDATGTIDSVINPTSGVIRADRIGELTLDADRIDPAKTTIVTR
ncbi:DUF3737 family protein [Bifidobacterium amazonense]|uniref:DUF3737 family protein n=1 Tax=Bifidobacterium amazonense TaxID=2809027 RepID=A0ABS9VVX6_9BIFI|nr:DUF3737 family protein [Bifidobacterium amazonense]MCH9276081.1 DUF3737 family protein [Bifidobacterium amazonense]